MPRFPHLSQLAGVLLFLLYLCFLENISLFKASIIIILSNSIYFYNSLEFEGQNSTNFEGSGLEFKGLELNIYRH